MRKTATKLADGRDLFYFDDSQPYVSGAKTRRLDDPRPLPNRFASLTPVTGTAATQAEAAQSEATQPGLPAQAAAGTPAAQSEAAQPEAPAAGTPAAVSGPVMRQDPLTGDWIPMASHRMNRTFLPPADANPLAPAQPGSAYQDGEIPDTDYDVVVFENRFPSLLAVPGWEQQATIDNPDLVDNQALFHQAQANGRCEVICFGPDLNRDLVTMGPKRMRTVIEAWADRTADLSQLPQVKQVFIFENHGQDIGVTLSHPHGQIYAYPYLTPRTQAMLRQARLLNQPPSQAPDQPPSQPHSQAPDQSPSQAPSSPVNLISAVREAEIQAGTRVIAQNQDWVMFVPVAARWPIEFHLMPLRTCPDFAALDESQRRSLADIYLRMLIIANHFHRDDQGTYLSVNYISAWHQAPVSSDEGRDLLGLHNQFFSFLRAPGKLKYLAGSESGMGAWISDTTPEKIAARAREAAREAQQLGAFEGLEVPVIWS